MWGESKLKFVQGELLQEWHHKAGHHKARSPAPHRFDLHPTLGDHTIWTVQIFLRIDEFLSSLLPLISNSCRWTYATQWLPQVPAMAVLIQKDWRRRLSIPFTSSARSSEIRSSMIWKLASVTRSKPLRLSICKHEAGWRRERHEIGKFANLVSILPVLEASQQLKECAGQPKSSAWWRAREAHRWEENKDCRVSPFRIICTRATGKQH